MYFGIASSSPTSSLTNRTTRRELVVSLEELVGSLAFALTKLEGQTLDLEQCF